MKVQIVEVDYRETGTLCLGSDEQIKEKFGMVPEHIRSGKEFMDFIKLATEEYTPDAARPLRKKLRYKKPYDAADIIVYDSLTALQFYIMNDILNGKVGMAKGDWDILNSKMGKEVLNTLVNTNKTTIFTCHTKDEKDGVSGLIRDEVGLQGGIKERLGQWFDIIIYTDVIFDKQKGKALYKFQILPNERRACRILPQLTEFAEANNGLIDQDWKPIMDKLVGLTPKILVLGRFGTGKTNSFNTLV